MMNRLFYFLFAFVVSIEFILLIVFFLLWAFHLDSVYTRVAEIIFKSNDLGDIAKQIGIPLALIGISFSQFKYVLQPDTELRDFYNWSDYLKLKDTFITGLIWNLLPVLTTSIIIFVCPTLNNQTKGFLYVGPLITSAYSTVTIIFARQKLKELLEKHKKNNKPSH